MAKKKKSKKMNPALKSFRKDAEIIHVATWNLTKRNSKDEFILTYLAARGLYYDIRRHAEHCPEDRSVCSKYINDLQNLIKLIELKCKEYDLKIKEVR